MMAFLQGTWGIVLQLSAALGVIAAILISIWVIVTKLGLFTGVIERRAIKKRLESCPQKAAMEAMHAKQEGKIEQLHRQLVESNIRTCMLHGSHIVVFCAFAQFRGFLPLYERDWLRKSFKEYKDNGGNGGVEEIYNVTMALPERLPRARKTVE